MQLSNTNEKFVLQFNEFINSAPQLHEPHWLKTLRGQALDSFRKEGGFPLTKNEEWKYTSLKPLTDVYFDLKRSDQSSGSDMGLSQKLNLGTGVKSWVRSGARSGVKSGPRSVTPFDGLKSHELVFLNGQYNARLSSVKFKSPQEAVLSSVQTVLQIKPELMRPFLEMYFYQPVKSIDPLFSLNTVFFSDGAYIYLPAGSIVVDPIHLIFISTQKTAPNVSHLRNLILAEPGSVATIVESYVDISLPAEEDATSPVEKAPTYFNNVVTEIHMGKGAHIEHYKFQNESRSSFHIATLDVTQGGNSQFISHSLAFGAKLSRNNIQVNFVAEDSECTLNGIYFSGKDQLIDHHTTVNHAKPRCRSKEFYKGILDGNSRSVFNGKVVVHQDAQGSDAKQENKNLLLSDDATINTKPQLEIYANDVKCTHGATIGQIDSDAVFYMRSRGISENLARNILTRAFVSDITSKIKLRPIREKIENLILSSFENQGIL